MPINLIDDDEDEDDVIQLPLRSYVESNEEMTESDCNVQEDDERTGMNKNFYTNPPPFSLLLSRILTECFLFAAGGGSASDSGRSIASSVSTEPFFSGQSAPTETQPASESAAQTPTPTQTQPTTDIDAATSANNNEQSTTPNTIEASTSQVPDAPQPDDANESQDTTEMKEQETVSNDDNADNNDIINVYSSGDEGE